MLESPDIHHLSAAVGWLELGNSAEALSELGKIAPCFHTHPDVLEVQCIVYIQQASWDAALETANALLQTDPDRPSGWLHYSYALRRATGGGLQAAWDALLPSAEAFPSLPTIPYNLACYACQLGEEEQAKRWFLTALEIGDKRTLIAMALRDEDLAPLADWIQGRSGKAG